jgi:hypothetical protein
MPPGISQVESQRVPIPFELQDVLYTAFYSMFFQHLRTLVVLSGIN